MQTCSLLRRVLTGGGLEAAQPKADKRIGDNNGADITN